VQKLISITKAGGGFEVSWYSNISFGEIVGAAGSVIGGIIGALGSAAAVFLMLRAQRHDEIERVSDAVLSEVVELCKSPIGQLNACAQIQLGTLSPPLSELRNLFTAPSPIVFPAVANMVSRLPWANLAVTFYMQLQETRGLIAVLENAFPGNTRVTGAHIQMLADLLISQCQLARFILRKARGRSGTEATLALQQRIHILRVLDEQLTAARDVFPNSESFRDQELPIGISAIEVARPT
jgi:hypothetical protein